MEEELNSYDENFLDHVAQSDLYKKWSTPINKKLSTTNAFDTEEHRVNFDSSNQDELRPGINPFLNQFVDLNAEDPYNEIRASNQSGSEQLMKGLGRATSKALTEVAKLPGVIVGSAAAPFVEDGKGMDMAFNNAWIRTLDGLNEKLKTDLLPVYTAKAVSEGNLWNNISSTSFWANEGADGIGFIAAMFVPGAIFQYAGLGGKLINSLSKSSKLNKYISMAGKAEEATTALKFMGISGKNIDSVMAVFGNTIFEAGAEAKGVGDNLDGQKNKFIDNYISQGYSLEQAEKLFTEQRALAMKDTFLANTAILLGPNAIMHKAIWGKAGKTFMKETEEGVKGVLKRVNKSGQRFAGATASEGFWEEGSQTTVENMFVTKAMNGQLGKSFANDASIGDFTKEYINTISSTDGQKAILLGGVFGGGMTSFQGRRSDVINRKQTNQVLDGIENQILGFNNTFDEDIYLKETKPDGSSDYVYKKDKDGNLTTQREIDNKVVYEIAKKLNFTEQQSQLFDVAVRTGNNKVVETLKQQAIFNMILPAVHNGEMGLQALEQKLNEDAKFNEILEKDKTADEKDKAKTFIKETLETAKYLQKQNEKFGDFSKDVIELKNDKATEAHKQDFLNRLNASYLNSKHQLRQDEKSLKVLEEKRSNILEESGLETNLQTEDEVLVRNEKTNALLKQVNDEIRQKELLINKTKKDISDIWQGTNINESFNEYVERENKKEQELSQEKIQQADDLINNVNNTSNKKELDALLLPAHKPQSTIEDYEKEIEHKAISEISNSISNDDSIENLKFNLEKLKSLTITSLKLNDTINDLEEKLARKLQEIEDFKDILLEAIGKYDEQNKKINDFISELNTEIDSLLKSKDTLIKSLDAQDKSPKGRNAKLIKELIKDAQNELKKVEKQIEYLEGLKEESKKELVKAEKELGYIFNRYDQADKFEFSSVQDIIDYLNSNKELFKDHRFDFERLLINKYYTEQNIEGLSTAIDELENYADVLKRTIRSLLNSTENHSEDLYYLQEQLNDVTEDLNQSKKDLKVAQEKLNRINKSITDKQAIESINNELDFWNDLKSYKEKNINPLVNNPAVQEVIEQKKEEFKQQEEEELAESKEEQLNLEEEAVINEEELPETIEPTITLDENDEFQSESIPTLEDEVDDNEVTESENMSEDEIEDSLNKEVSGAKVISTVRYSKEQRNNSDFNPDIEEGEAIYNNLKAFVDYERTPRDKSKDIVTFNVGDISNGDVELAYNKLIKGVKLSPKEVKLLEDGLPIKVNILYSEGKELKTVSSFIEAKSKYNQSNKDSKEILEQQTMPLRKNIIAQAIKNKSLEGIQSNIVKQYPGLLKVDYNEEGVVKNDIFDLQVFDGMNEVEKVDYFQRNTAFVDWSGNLVSTLNKNKKIRTNFGVEHKGEVFLKIPQNNGTEFWLKLNVAKISEAKAEAVYEIVNALSQVSQTINSPTSFQAMTIDTFFETLSESNPELSEKIKDTLSYEIALVKTFNKGKTQNESLSRFLDLIIYHKSQNAKTGFHLSKDGNLKLGSLAMHLVNGSGFKHLLHITKDELNTPEAKQIIMEYVQYKRHNILITKDSANLFIFNNKEYVKYLLNSNEPLLTTNAVVNQPTFQGYSNVYLNQEVSNTTEENKSVIPMKPKNKFAVEDVDISIEVAPTNEQGENLQTKSAFEALLKIKSQPKNKQEVKMDIDYVKDSYNKASDDVKAEILFTLAENLNAVDDIDFDNLTETFNKLIDSALKANKSIEEINKICGL